jgi:DNA-binding response OmpR family regulator
LKILIIEDEKSLRESIEEYFKGTGNLCETAANYSVAIEKISLYRYDCILLDITLPDGDGLSLLKNLKENNHSDGILIISARDSLDDRLQGLDLGADDYLVKPFHLSELRSRIAAITRRKTFNGTGSNLLTINEITIDLIGKVVKIRNQDIKLTPKEYALLLYFIANRGKVVSKNAIAEHLWGDGVDITDDFNFIYAHIKNIRKKLMEASGKDYIRAAYGMGYKFVG